MYSNESLTDPDRQPDLDQIWVENFTTIYDIRNDLMRRMEEHGKESLGSNVLNSVGVGDYNKAFDLLDPATQSLIKPPIYLYDIGESAKIRYLSILGERARSGSYGFEDHRFPIFSGGMVDRIASTELFCRLGGINQINMVEWYPLRNEQTRASHSINTAVYMLRALQSVHDKDKSILLSRLQQDFASHDIDVEGVDDESLVELTSRLTVAVGMLHDLFTPAGGDIVKRAVGMNEEEDIELLLSSPDGRVDEVRQVLADFGIDGDLLEFVVSCVKGESESLIGDMIHPSDSTNVLDIDQIAYTLWDAKAAGIVKEPVLLRDQGEGLDLGQEGSLIKGVNWAEWVLCENQSPYAGASRLAPNNVLPLSDLDPIEGYRLSVDGKLINERPGLVTAVIGLRIFMSTEVYRGTKMVGYDKDLEKTLREMKNSDEYGEILSKDNLLRATTKELLLQLSDTADRFDNPTPFETFADSWKLRRYTSEVIRVDEGETASRNGVKFGFRTGLDTPVIGEDGAPITVFDYIEGVKDCSDGAENSVVSLIDRLTAKYNKNTMRVVSSQPAKENKFLQFGENYSV